MLSPGDTRRALDMMSGEIHASLVHVLFAQSRTIAAMASDRLWEMGPGGGAAWAGGERQQMMSLGLAPAQLGERMGLGYAEREAAQGRLRGCRPGCAATAASAPSMETATRTH